MTVIAALLVPAGTALAHEQRDVGKYHFVVGFIVEPPFEGQKNGVDLRATTKNAGGTDQPVEGLVNTLQVEITHIASNTTKVFALRTIFRDPGHYTNDLLLTAPGHYRFRFFGNVEGTPVNETFTTEDGKFKPLGSSADIQFPTKLTEVREIEAAVRGAQNTAEEAHEAAHAAEDSTSSARTMAVVGIVLGAVGIASGVGSAVMASRRRRQQ